MLLKNQLLLVIAIVCCTYCKGKYANMYYSESINAGKMCSENDVGFQKVVRSAISCVKLCTAYPGCTSLIFHPGNNTCIGLIKVMPSFVSSFPGAVFYRKTKIPEELSPSTTQEPTTPLASTSPGCKEGSSGPMVADVLDSQMTASSTYGESYAAWEARIGGHSNWTPRYEDANDQQYLMAVSGETEGRDRCGLYTHNESDPVLKICKVDFLNERLATSVLTRGDGSVNEWVTSYRVLVSLDCATFDPVVDIYGFPQVFTGNYDMSSVVTNSFHTPVPGRCFMINPVTWNSHIAIQLEIIGCVP